MKLYTKQLRNLKELKLEKKRLRQEQRELDKEPIFSMDDVMGEVGGITSGLAGGLLPLVTRFAGPLAGVAAGLGSKLFSRKANSKSGTKPEPDAPDDDAHPNVLKSVAVELFGNYLKWKALELSYKGISLIVKKRKKKKAERKVAEEAAAIIAERRGL